jgi:spermidine synthase
VTDAEGGYWKLLLPASGCPRRALILGLGGGTVAALLARCCPGVTMVGIERDETVLALARTEFALDAIAGLEVVVADAFAWVAGAAEDEAEQARGAFDYICLDLYDGGRLAPGTLASPFLRHLAALLALDGTLVVNLIVTGRLGEQLHRLRRVFAVVREERVRGNVVVHLRALS